MFIELIEVINRSKFDKYLSKKRKKELIKDLTETALFIEPTQIITDCRDSKDNKYLELAITVHTECIITGDQDLLVLNPFRGIPILTVQEFKLSPVYSQPNLFFSKRQISDTVGEIYRNKPTNPCSPHPQPLSIPPYPPFERGEGEGSQARQNKGFTNSPTVSISP